MEKHTEKKIPVSFRLSPEVKNLLEVAARESGVTATQELERRITASLFAKDYFAKVYGERFAQLLKDVAGEDEKRARVRYALVREGIDPTPALKSIEDRIEQLRRELAEALEESGKRTMKRAIGE
jgi:hypothetical protein